MNFKKWLVETGTSTGDVAGFSRIAIGHVRRGKMPLITFGGDNHDDCGNCDKKKKKKKKKKIKEATSTSSSNVQKAKLKNTTNLRCSDCKRPVSTKSSNNYFGRKLCDKCMGDIATGG